MSIHVAMPANIRFKFYPSREKVKYENKFTGLCVEAPLTPKMDLKSVKTITNRIKGSVGMIYAGYASARQIDHRPGDWNEKKISAFVVKPPPRPSPPPTARWARRRRFISTDTNAPTRSAIRRR